MKIGIEGTKNLSNVDDYLFWLILIAGHSFRSRDHPFASGISDWSISSEDDKDKPEPEVFTSTTQADPDALANQFEEVELDDGAKTANIDKSPQSRQIVYFSTEFDVIATEDEEWEPSVRREWKITGRRRTRPMLKFTGRKKGFF